MTTWTPLWEEWPSQHQFVAKIVLRDGKFQNVIGLQTDDGSLFVPDWPDARIVAWAPLPEDKAQ